MATSDYLMRIILSEFTDAETLREWAIENGLFDDPLVLERLRFLPARKKCEIKLRCETCQRSYTKDYFRKHVCQRKCEMRCRKCNQTFEDRKEFYSHHMNVHHRGGAELQDIPFDIAPWQDDQGNVIDPELERVYDTHRSLILDAHTFGPVTSLYNFPIDNTFDVETIMNQVRYIYNNENQVIRVNFIFGIILRNRETGEYRYFKPYKNNEVFKDSIQINDATDLHKIRIRVREMNFNDYVLHNRPNSKWIPVMVTNVRYWVNKTNFPMGVGLLPEYLKAKMSLIGLDSNGRFLYEDNLCAFRCYAYHIHSDLFVKSTKNKPFEQKVKLYLKKYESYCKSRFGVLNLEDLPTFEACFEININIFQLSQEDIVTPIFKSLSRFEDTMNLNLYQSHLSYIKRMDSYCQKYKCIKCEKLFKTNTNLIRHFKNCDSSTKYIYPGGFYQTPNTIFEQMEEVGIYVEEEERFFPWFMVFDFESLLIKDEIKTTEKLTWTHKHVPISVSVCSNVNGFDKAKCFVDVDSDRLLKSLVDYIYLISDEVYKMALSKWSYVFDCLNIYATPLKRKHQDMVDEIEIDKATAMRVLLNRFIAYCRQTPVLGFNCSKYDLPLIKEKLGVLFEDQEDCFVVKRNNAYMVFADEKIKILDISNYLAPGSSYSQFLRAYKIEEEKGFFPYEWLDSVEKLQQTYLPTYGDFYSSLKKCNVLNCDGKGSENYSLLQEIWLEKEMETMEDFLVYYNNLDVSPFVKAVEKMQKFYFKRGLDLFKISISLPGIARKMMFDSAKSVVFSLFDENNKDLYKLIKRNMTGGPAIIFNRYQKVDETMISEKHICKSVIGLDANALYLWAIGLEMPTGSFVRRKSPDFKPIHRDKFMKMFIWMDWLSREEGVDISHKLNSGKEKKISPFSVDGYDRGSRKVYEYNGCWYHGHNCVLNRHDKNRDDKFNRTMERLNYIQSKGYDVVVIWECEFESMIDCKNELRSFVEETKPPFCRKYPRCVTESQILKSVRDGDFFGAVECDIHVPDELFSLFSEYSPLFANTNVPFDKIGKHMQEHVLRFDLSQKPRRLLVGGMKAEKIFLASKLLQWYMKHGLKVTQVYEVVEYIPQKCFRAFTKEVAEARREGDRDDSMSIIGDTMKLVGNSAYGSSIMNKEKHTNIKYVQNLHSATVRVNDPFFKKLTELNYNCFEVETFKKRITLNLPIQLGYFILQYAKLRMLQFHYDCMLHLIPRPLLKLIETDTDSMYYAFAGEDLESTICNEKKSNYNRMVYGSCDDSMKPSWFPRKCCEKHARYDNRTPGLFKKEYAGTEVVALCSKTYIVTNKWNGTIKFSSKGISRRSLGEDLLTKYKKVLDTQEKSDGVNTGFRMKKNNIYTYTQTRSGFTYFYCKREVLEDGVSTKPLDIILKP